MSTMDNVNSQSVELETIVVGAGPVGLAAALALRAKGHAVTMLEAEKEGRVRPGSRAIFVHKATLKLIEQMLPGLGYQIASHGLVWPTKRTFWRGKQVYVRDYPTPAPKALPPFSSLPQVEIERFLMNACIKAGVQFVWEAQVSAVTTTPANVTIETMAGQSYSAKYVVAADGSRSAVRHALNIPMEGSRSQNTFVVVDVAEDEAAPLPKERVFHYQHPAVNGRNVLLVPFVGGWRVDLQCHAIDDPEEFSGLEGVKKWLPKVMPAKYADRITWVSTYQFLQLVAREFTDTHKRVLLVGEAAHLFAPFGARGMNSGVADAFEAATAVDKALVATSPEQTALAIDNFAENRRGAALYNRDAAGTALTHMTARNPTMQTKRVLAALVSPYWKKAGQWLDEGPYGPRAGPPGQTAGKY